MAKKKKKNKSNTQQAISPKQYIRTRARNLPVSECLINSNWQESGLANIIVARQHKSGNYTIGIFLVDLYCLGVKDADYSFNISDEEFDEVRSYRIMESVSYDIVHNIIYGGLAYAEELGIAPHTNFALAQYILEEDTDDIPLIEFEFGMDGKPFLLANSKLELSRYQNILDKTTGGDYRSALRYDDGYDDFDYDDSSALADLTPEEIEANLEKHMVMMERSKSLPFTEYSYKHPEYPKELNLTHSELNIILQPESNVGLNREIVDQLLGLPRETLIKDLEHCILYSIGQCLDEGQLWQDDVYGSVGHCLLLLGEQRAEESLDVVLQTMRQDEECSDFFFGDFADRFLILTLYYTAFNQLDKLLDYVKEPGLNNFIKTYVFNVPVMIEHHHPERRPEIIEWFREVLNFLYEKRNDSAYYDAGLAGMMMGDLMDLHAVELLPEIEQLFDTDLVDEMPAGNFQTVKEEIIGDTFGSMKSHKLLNIYERYEFIGELFS